MIPFAPELTIRPVDAGDVERLLPLLASHLAQTPYCTALEAATVVEQILAPDPPTVFPVRWLQRSQLGAWRARQLVGFVDVAVGHDSESLARSEYRPLGLLRFMALPQDPSLATEVAAALLEAAEHFWRTQGVGYVRAFHISTGYPVFQVGAGILPGNWHHHMRALTAAGFQLCERYYCLYRPLARPLEEVTPLALLSLVYQGNARDRTYQVYRRTDWVGRARMVRAVVDEPRGGSMSVAYVADLYVDVPWRQQDIGKWLLRRLINDATLQGYVQMVVHLAHGWHAAMNLFIQQGFQELDYRGYTLEKVLTR